MILLTWFNTQTYMKLMSYVLLEQNLGSLQKNNS